MRWLLALVTLCCVIASRNGLLANANGAPTIQPFSFSKNVTFGGRMKTLCTATGKEPLSFEWNKDGQPLHNSATVRIQTHDDFSIVSLTPVDYSSPGNYTCIVKNSEGSTSYSAQLLIQAPPKWLREPSDEDVASVGLEGRISLDCEVRGHPRPVIRWFKISGGVDEQHRQLLDDERFEVSDKNGSLVIQKVKPEDAGDYECRASNDIGAPISRKITLTVHVPAHFEKKFEVESVRLGEGVVLRCTATGDTPITLTWTKDDVALSEKDQSSRYDVYESSNSEGSVTTSELHIQVTSRDDNGLYLCIAKNAFGKDERTFKLIILEVPGPPSDVRVEQSWSQSAIVRWNVPYGGNSPITSFVVQFWRDAGAPHKLEEESVSASQTFTMLKDLQPGTSYVLRVMAENEVGRGNPSESAQFNTKEAEPSSPPTDVTVEPHGAATLRVKWKSPPRDQWNGQLKGYYIGWRKISTEEEPSPYSFKAVDFSKSEGELTDLERGAEYSVIVQAYNSAGSGPPSQEALARTSLTDPPLPPFLWVDFQSRSSIRLKWKQPPSSSSSNNDTADDDTHYTLFYKDEGYGPWSEVSVPRSAEGAYTLGGLREGTRYQIYLKSTSEAADPSGILTLKTEGGALSDMSSHPVVVEGGGGRGVGGWGWLDLQPALLIPLASSAGLIFVVLTGACLYVRRAEKRNKAAISMQQPDGRYSYNGSSTLPHQQRYKDPPPLLRIPLPPHPPPEGYPLPYATMPIRNNTKTVQRIHHHHATMDRNKGRDPPLTIQETAEVHHHYDMAA